MRQSNRTTPVQSKELARRKYAQRQIDKFVKWSIEKRGYVKYKHILEYHEKYNIKCYHG
jgi:hypothetical protein